MLITPKPAPHSASMRSRSCSTACAAITCLSRASRSAAEGRAAAHGAADVRLAFLLGSLCSHRMPQQRHVLGRGSSAPPAYASRSGKRRSHHLSQYALLCDALAKALQHLKLCHFHA